MKVYLHCSVVVEIMLLACTQQKIYLTYIDYHLNASDSKLIGLLLFRQILALISRARYLSVSSARDVPLGVTQW